MTNEIFLHEKQMLVYQSTARFRVVVAGRRWGKCLHGDTLISMADGTEKPIKDIKVGDYVLSMNESLRLEPKMVTYIASNGVRETVKITTSGRSVISTPNHPHLVNKEFTEARNILPGDLLGVRKTDGTVAKASGCYPISYDEMASRIHVSKDVVTQHLRGWRKEGKSKITRKRYEGLRPYSDGFYDDVVYGDVAWEPVVSVEPCGTYETWDMTVEGNHNFIANGVVTHNTQVAKALMIKYSKVPNRLIWYVAPSYRMAKDIMWPELKSAMPRVWVQRINETALEMTLINGTRLALKGADNPDSLRGVGIHFLVMDEVQDISPDAWTKVLRPTLASTGGHALFLGTPKAYNFLYDLFMLGQKSENRAAHRWMSWQFPTITSPFIPKEEIEAAMSDMDEKSFRQEFCHLSETEVMLANGFVSRIKDLMVGSSLLYLDDKGEQQVCHVSDIRMTGEKEVTEVALETGESFCASSEHKMKVHVGGVPEKMPLNKVEWVEKSDFLFRPSTRDEKFAALVGYVTGDGNIAIKRERYRKQNGDVSVYDRVAVAFYGNYLDDLNDISNDLKDCGFAHNAHPLPKKNRVGSKTPYTYQIQFSESVAKKLLALGAPLGKKVACEFRVPDWIMNGTNGVKRSYLGALFGAEGTFPNTKGVSGKIGRMPLLGMCKVECDGISFFEDLKRLASDLGIKCSIRMTESVKYGKVYKNYVLAVLTESVFDFYKNVSYVHCKVKAKEAFKMANYIKTRECFAVQRVNAIVERREKMGMSFYRIARELNISDGEVYGVYSRYRRGASQNAGHHFPPYDEWIKERWDEQKQLLKLKAVFKKTVGFRQVMNITVDSPDHSYLLANGLNNYNCASFEVMTGRAYHAFDRKVHVKSDIAFNPALPIWIGQDFNLDPMSSVILQPQPDGTVWCVDEIVLRGSNTEEVCEEIERRYWRHMKNIYLFPDPAGQYGQHARGESDLDIFRERGINKQRFHRKHPLVVDRINAVNRMFKSADGRIRLYVSDRCKTLINSLEQTIYRKGTREIDKAANVEHSADALGYCIHYQFPVRSLEFSGISI